MKNVIMDFVLSFILFFIVFSNLYSQDISQGEFMIVNNSGENGYPIKVDIYPVGAIFNGNYDYALKSKYPIDPQQNNKIFGIQQITLSNLTSQTWYTVANFDNTSELRDCQFSLGYGRYRVDFFKSTNGGNNWNQVNTTDIDFSDANFTGYTTPEYFQKLIIHFVDDNTIYFNYIDNQGNNTQNEPISYDDKWIRVWKQSGTGHEGTLMQNKGNFTDYSTNGIEYHDFPIDATKPPYNFFKHSNPQEVYLNLDLTHYDANLQPNYQLNFDNCTFHINDNITFTVNGPYLTIDGVEGKFSSGYLSTIIFPPGGQFTLSNHSIMNSVGSIFTSNSEDIWNGIILSNTNSVCIKDCEIHNALIPVFSQNSVTNPYNLSIINNKIWIPNDDMPNNGLQLINVYNVHISDNVFYSSQGASLEGAIIYIENDAPFSDNGNDLPKTPCFDIRNNQFYDGISQIVIYEFTSMLLPVTIKNNQFYGGQNNLVCLSVVGDITDNTFKNPYSSEEHREISNIQLSNSSPNFYNNTINNYYDNISVENHSYPNLAPIQIGEQYIWYGGLNHLASSNSYNIISDDDNYNCNISTSLGHNDFHISQPDKYHIYAKLNIPCDNPVYYAYCNTWWINDILSEPSFSLFGSGGCQITGNWIYPGNCDFENQIVDRIITDKGNGIIDTILITQSNNTPPSNEDETLYALGEKNILLNNYSSSILNFKNLLNNYPNNKHLERTIYDLYECYVMSDTNHTQNWRNVIFGDLKNYLENKILQYQNDEEFANVAFDFFLKYAINKKNYSEALSGYSLIVNNSPSAFDRLLASINYIIVEGLIQGSGGGEKENDNSLILKNFYKPEKEQNAKPINQILLNTYSKTKISKMQKEKVELQNSKNISKTKAAFDKKHNFEKKLEDRALNNINISSSLSKEQRRERIRIDSKLLSHREDFSESFNENESIPVNYSLSQNYPNPFNPVAKINYSIQKQGLVILKVYDILGREIRTLVNEVKSPGNYLVEFNGSEFASGVYFYRIQAGNFNQVKKMILIK